MSWKTVSSHILTFSLGLLCGIALATKACPPTPAPAGQPKIEEPKPIEAKAEAKAPEVQDSKAAQEIKADSAKSPEVKPEAK